MLILTGLLCLGACTSVPQANDRRAINKTSQDSVLELALDQQAGVLDTATLDDGLVLPNLELDAPTLEQLLVTNLASYQGRWSEATQSAMAAASHTRDPRLARIATLLSLRNNNYASAAEAGTLWLELAPDSEDASNMLIIAQVGADQVDAALTLLQVHRKDKSIDRHIRQVAGLLVRQRNDKAAMEVSKHYVETYGESAQVMLSMAYVAETFKQLEPASEWLTRALDLKPGWDLAAQMKANMLRRQGKPKERSQFIADYVSAYPASVTMRINHAAELARDDQFQLALELMQKILLDAPRDVPALSYAAALALQLDDVPLAKKYYTKALYEDPKDDDVRWSLARIAVIQEKYATAESLYSDIADEKNYISAQLQVANMRYHTQGIKVAVNTLRALQPETEAEYIEIALTRHYLLMQDRQYEEAYGYVNETLIYLPDNQDLLYARALVAAELNKVEIAEADLRAVIKSKPDHANAINALGYTLADQTDRYAEALELIEAALVLRPKDSHILDSRGWVAYKMGEYAIAIDYLEQAYTATPQVEIAAHLGEVLWESGDQERANKIWQESYAEDPDNPVLNQALKKYGVNFSTSKP